MYCETKRNHCSSVLETLHDDFGNKRHIQGTDRHQIPGLLAHLQCSESECLEFNTGYGFGGYVTQTLHHLNHLTMPPQNGVNGVL